MSSYWDHQRTGAFGDPFASGDLPVTRKPQPGVNWDDDGNGPGEVGVRGRVPEDDHRERTDRIPPHSPPWVSARDQGRR